MIAMVNPAKRRASGRVLIAAASIVAGASVVASEAHAQTPVATACPAGFEYLSVDALEAAGPYLLPRRVDTAGNNNGYVCGQARPDSVRDAFCKQGGGNACNLAQLGLPIYLFTDDDNPAADATSG